MVDISWVSEKVGISGIFAVVIFAMKENGEQFENGDQEF